MHPTLSLWHQLLPQNSFDAHWLNTIGPAGGHQTILLMFRCPMLGVVLAPNSFTKAGSLARTSANGRAFRTTPGMGQAQA